MPDIMLFVEDELNEAYKILVRKALGLPLTGSTGRRIRVAKVTLNELTDFSQMLDLTLRAHRSGCKQVVFCMDHEGHDADRGRVWARDRFREAFQRLCDYIEGLPANNHLKSIRLLRVEVHTCLESWLLSDPKAIVEAFGPTNYRPSLRRTEGLTPREARENIAHIMREIGRRKRKHHLARVRGSAIKSHGERIARYIDLTQARQWNFSLNYFCSMIEANGHGCEQPFPNPP